MASFKEYYRTLFRTFGYPLAKRSAMPPEVITAAEKRLGVRVPGALRYYYLVAGRERRFNTSLNRLLSPSQWAIDKKRLIFMEENQAVVVWGVSLRFRNKSNDPPISQGVNEEPISWHPEHPKCSV